MAVILTFSLLFIHLFSLTTHLELPEYPVACAIILGGSGDLDIDGRVGSNLYYKQLADQLSAQQIATLRFPKRSGVIKDMNEELLDDAREAIAIAQQTGLPLFLIGHSLGGILAPALAQNTPISGLVLIAITLRDPIDLIIDQVEILTALNPARYRPLLARLVQEKHSEIFLDKPFSYWEDWALYARNFVDLIHAPALIIGMGNDYQTRHTDFKKIRTQLPHLDYLWMPQLNHFFSRGSRFYVGEKQAVDTDFVCEVARWIHSIVQSPS